MSIWAIDTVVLHGYNSFRYKKEHAVPIYDQKSKINMKRLQLEPERQRTMPRNGKNAKDIKAHKTPLGVEEKKKLKKFEEMVIEHWKSHYKVGEALFQIQTQKLYRENYESFKDYCEKHFEISKAHAYRLIKLFHVWEKLDEEEGAYIPEYRIRELKRLKKDHIQEVWKAAKAHSEGKIPDQETLRKEVDCFIDEHPEEYQKNVCQSDMKFKSKALKGVDINLEEDTFQELINNNKVADVTTVAKLFEEINGRQEIEKDELDEAIKSCKMFCEQKFNELKEKLNQNN